MRNWARRPDHTRFSSIPYAFSVKLKNRSVEGTKSQPFDALRLVWHDYPGEWFEQDVSGPEEAQRRVATFKSLLGADVAFFLVDGQRLLDNAGEEERYLKALLGSFRTGLLRLEDQLLDEGRPLVRFPRIWILALSKADLLPELDVFAFRDLVIEKASADLDELRKVLKGLVASPDALAVGEDFVLLSSAKFEPNRIEVTERIGLDLVLALAATLPFERHVRWAEQRRIAGQVVEELLAGAPALAAALIGKAKYGGPKGLAVWLAGRAGVTAAMSAAAKLGSDQLRRLNADALAKREYMSAVLTRFRLDLNEGEENGILLRSQR
jgi:hypothetical protein